MKLRSGATITAAAWLCCIAGGCSGIEVGSGWAPQTVARASLGETFAWGAQSEPAGEDMAGLPPPLRDLLRSAVERELAAKGYRTAASDQATFWVRCRSATETRGDPHSSAPFEQYREGGLRLYVISPSSGEWLWRAWGNARLDEGNSPAEKRARLESAVRMMMKDLPPAGASAQP